MESKKTFGEYICRRRKELGMTQREFADKLYVTESAVSKWERGMSYPDVTLLRDICAVLDVSEHELLTASVDTEKRTAERLAAKYLRLTRNYRIFWYLVFGGVLLGCAIGNLAAGHTLDWFWIALAAVLLAASLTLVPALATMHSGLEKHKWAMSIGCATASLELLLLICCLYTGGSWFPVAGLGTLLGITLVVLPPLLPTLPLPAALAGRRTSLYLGTETALLLTLLLACWLTYGGTWLPGAVMGTVFGLSLLFTPVFLRQLPLPEGLAQRKLSLYLGVEPVLLLALLLTCQLAYGGGVWFPVSAAGVLFGLGLVFLPVILRQLPLPAPVGHHRTLLYFLLETALLLLLLAAADWTTGGGWLLSMGLPLAGLGLALPWGLMALIRYLPVNGWFRASACCLWTGAWSWFFPWGMEQIMTLNGQVSTNPWQLFFPVDFAQWAPQVVASGQGWVHISYQQRVYNIFALALLGVLILAVALAVTGAVRVRQAKKQ